MTCILAYPNRVDESTLAGGSWTTGLPLANLQTRLVSQYARTADATNASTQFKVTLARARVIRTFGVINHNLSLAANFRIRSYTDAAFTVLQYDSGWQSVWPTVIPMLARNWEDSNFWDGKILDEDRKGFQWNLVHNVPSTGYCFAQYFTVEFDDATNSAGYVQLGRFFLSDQWQPLQNMDLGASLAYETKTVVDEAYSGAEYYDERVPFRVARFTLSDMSEDEAMARALDIQRVLGISKEVLYQWDRNDTIHSLRRTFLGRLRTLSTVENPYPLWNKSSFEVKEIIG